MLIACNLCIYVATCEEQLNWHLCEEHVKDDKLFLDSDYSCNICGKWCRSDEDLARHELEHAVKSSKDQTGFQFEKEEVNVSCSFCDKRYKI